MSERLVTERELSGVLRRLTELEQRLGRVEVTEVPIVQAGTWTPALFGDGTAGSFTYDLTNTGGEYTRDADRVDFNGRVRITAITVAPTGNMYITLPSVYTVATVAYTAGVGGSPLIQCRGVTMSAGHTWISGYLISAQARLYLNENGSAVAPANIQGTQIALVGGSLDFIFAGHYRIV